MSKCGACGGSYSNKTLTPHAYVCDDDLAGGSRSPYSPEDETRWDYYTVTLDKGRISYSPVICGDCLIELERCGHGSDIRHKSKTGRK